MGVGVGVWMCVCVCVCVCVRDRDRDRERERTKSHLPNRKDGLRWTLRDSKRAVIECRLLSLESSEAGRSGFQGQLSLH